MGFIAGILKVLNSSLLNEPQKKKKNLCSIYNSLLCDTKVVTCLYQCAIETEQRPKPWHVTMVSGVMRCAVLLLKMMSFSGLGTTINNPVKLYTRYYSF